MKTKRLLSLFFVSVFVLLLSTPALALEAPKSGPNSSNSIEPKNMYDYAWKVEKVEDYGPITYGSWREGPTGRGPGSLSITDSTTVSFTFTNTITGQYSIGLSSIEAAVGCEIGIELTHAADYTITLGDNVRKTIIFRPKLQVVKVTTEYWRYPTGATYLDPELLETEICYVTKFIEWDYDWRYGY